MRAVEQRVRQVCRWIEGWEKWLLCMCIYVLKTARYTVRRSNGRISMYRHMFYTCLIYLHILRIYIRIYCVYPAYIWCMLRTYIYACYTTYWICSIYCVYTCVYTAYILRISGVCLLTYVSRDLYIGSTHTWYAWYTAYIHAYILRTSSHIWRMLRTCVYGVYVACI